MMMMMKTLRVVHERPHDNVDEKNDDDNDVRDA